MATYSIRDSSSNFETKALFDLGSGSVGSTNVGVALIRSQTGHPAFRNANFAVFAIVYGAAV